VQVNLLVKKYLDNFYMKHYEIAQKEIGVREIVGSKHTPRVLEYFAKVGHSWVKDDETAWCAAFVGWVLETAGLPSTRKLNARSYLTYGTPVTTPQKGDIVVFWRVAQDSWQGHVAFFDSYSPDGDIMCLGGNQSNKVGISEYDTERLLEFRRPPGVPTLSEPQDCTEHLATIASLQAENKKLKTNFNTLKTYVNSLTA